MDALRSHPTGLRTGLVLAWFLVLAAVNWLPLNVNSAPSASSLPGTAKDVAQRQGEWALSADGHAVRDSEGETFAVRTVGPFIVLGDWEVVRQRWLSTSWVPLADLFAGTEYHAFDEIIRKTLQFSLLGALLVPATGRFGRAIWRPVLAGFCLACLFEAGQLFVPGRLCSISDITVETGGAMLGFLAFSRLLVSKENRPADFPATDQRDQSRRLETCSSYV
jgi:hypothetical protein